VAAERIRALQNAAVYFKRPRGVRISPEYSWLRRLTAEAVAEARGVSRYGEWSGFLRLAGLSQRDAQHMVWLVRSDDDDDPPFLWPDDAPALEGSVIH
jgi:hypothetical protein